MEFRVKLNIIGKTISSEERSRILHAAGLNLYDNYEDKCRIKQHLELWYLKVDDLMTIDKVRAELYRHLPQNVFVQERLIPQLKSLKIEQGYFLVFRFSNDASRAEATHHTDSVLTCQACGNCYQDPDFIPKIKPELLPGKPILMGFYGPLKIFCRPKFIKLYKQAGLTGLSFVDWGINDKHKVPLSLVHVAQHRWQERAGVCDTCEMKTNFTNSFGILNTYERFQYDFQYVRAFNQGDGDVSTNFVLSDKALDFILSHGGKTAKSHWMQGQGLYPILPGYMEDYVWPEPKLFAHGEIPLYMLRSSWDKAGK